MNGAPPIAPSSASSVNSGVSSASTQSPSPQGGLAPALQHNDHKGARPERFTFSDFDIDDADGQELPAIDAIARSSLDGLPELESPLRNLVCPLHSTVADDVEPPQLVAAQAPQAAVPADVDAADDFDFVRDGCRFSIADRGPSAVRWDAVGDCWRPDSKSNPDEYGVLVSSLSDRLAGMAPCKSEVRAPRVLHFYWFAEAAFTDFVQGR